jgi:hypothetical protein
MSPPNDVVLRADGLELTIHELNRTQGEDGNNPYDFWVNCEVLVTVPNFAGSFRWMALQKELETLADEIEKLVAQIGKEAAFTFRSLEPAIELSLRMNILGQISGRYVVTAGPDGPELRGGFGLDQTYLVSLAAAVRNLAAA